jgi:bla regulator protein blaR1
MTPAIGHAVLAISNSLAASVIVKATIVISSALVAAYFARHNRASVRHAILAAGFAVLLALPIAAVLAPPIHITLPLAQGSSTLAINSSQSLDETSLAPRAATNAPSSGAKSEATGFSLFELLFVAWAIGAAIFLAPVILGLWQVRSLRRTALPWSYGNSLAATLADELRLRRRIEVLLHESIAGPMTCGVFRPSLVFPVEAEIWNEADLNRAIAHELEHVRRADWLTHCLARIVCAAYWFHPLVWIAWSQLTLEAERACDDAVLARSEATAYAEQLVALARQLTAANKSPLLAMAGRSDLATRVGAVLDVRQRRGRAGVIALTLTTATALFAIIVSPVEPVTANQAKMASEAAAPGYEVTSVKIDPSGNPNRNVTWRETPDGLTLENVTVELLIRQAYGLHTYQIEHEPEWAAQKEFDISARIGSDEVRHLQMMTKEQAIAERQTMLQSLLADRFHLEAHHETKDGPSYSLVLAKNGPKFHEGPPAPSSGSSALTGPPVVMGNGLLKFNGAPMSTLARLISQVIGRPVLDHTGLPGKYEFTLKWTPDEFDLPATAEQPDSTSPEPAGTSIFTVIQDQLGLKLESTKSPVDILVVDHIEPATPN